MYEYWKRSIKLILVLTFLFLFSLASWHFTAFAGPLHDAAFEGNYSAAKRLIDAGANVNELGRPVNWGKWMKSYPPLFYAVSYVHKDVAKLLIKMGADVNFIDDYSQSLLHHAAGPSSHPDQGSWEIGTLLLEHGANPNSATPSGETPLHVGARNNDSGDRWVRLLVESGAKINVVNSEGSSPILEAVMSDNMKAARYLAKQGATIKNDLPDNVPLDVRVLVDGLLVDSALTRGKSARDLGNIGPRAKPAILYLEKILDDQRILVRGQFAYTGEGKKTSPGILAREAISKILHKKP